MGVAMAEWEKRCGARFAELRAKRAAGVVASLSRGLLRALTNTSLKSAGVGVRDPE